MVFHRGLQFPARHDFQLVDLPVLPHYLVGWFIEPATMQPGKIVFVVDNRVAPGGYGTEDVGWYLDVSPWLDGTYAVNMYPTEPVFGPSVLVPAGKLMVFELDSYLPGQKLDLSHGEGFYVTLESEGAASKTKLGVWCGSPLQRLEWMGIIA